MITTDLCRFTTSDQHSLHGLLFRPGAAAASDRALLMVHGVGGSFYTGPLLPVGQALADRGYPCLTINTRGHDWISRTGGGDAFSGASFENFEDCELDIDGALAFLQGQGYTRVVLFGHSLGAVKAVYYQGRRRHPAVVGVIAGSGPKQFYSARVEEQPDFPSRMEEAEAMAAAGRGEELMWALASGRLAPFSARTYISKYGTHERNDIRPLAGQLPCPLLATAGSLEAKPFHDHVRELASAATRGTGQIVDGANHGYDGRREQLTEIVTGWLTQELKW